MKPSSKKAKKYKKKKQAALHKFNDSKLTWQAGVDRKWHVGQIVYHTELTICRVTGFEHKDSPQCRVQFSPIDENGSTFGPGRTTLLDGRFKETQRLPGLFKSYAELLELHNQVKDELIREEQKLRDLLETVSLRSLILKGEAQPEKTLVKNNLGQTFIYWCKFPDNSCSLVSFDTKVAVIISEEDTKNYTVLEVGV